jgi:serine/threonine protein phosphatase PrpC
VTRLRAGAATDVGLVRANNQDQLLVDDPVFAVADGMGGHAAGEVASRTAVDALQIAFHDDDGSDGTGPEAVAEAVRAANRAVWEQAQAHAELRGMGTTLTAIALVPFTPAHGAAPGRDGLAVANVGDSRTYRLRHGQLEQLTVDHSYVAELVAEGRIDAAEAEFHPQRHVLTRALGVAPDVDVDLMTVDAEPDDRYLLCSDGLSREVTDAQIASVLRRLVDPGDAARELVAEAKRRGGNDNITVVGGVNGDDAPPAEPTQAVPVVVAPAAARPGGDGTGPDGPDGGVVPDAALAAAAAAPAPSGTPAPTAGTPTAGTEAASTTDAGTKGSRPRGSGTENSGAENSGTKRSGTNGSGTNGAGATTRGTGRGGTAPGDDGRDGAGSARPGRRERRRLERAGRAPRPRVLTLRLVLFFVGLLVILGAAFAGTAYYARSTYFVALRGRQITIFQGRPGGVLWWKPTVARASTVTTAQIEPHNLAALRTGVQEASLSAAQAYIDNLVDEKRLLEAVPTTTVPAPTVPSTTPTTVATTPSTAAGRGATHHRRTTTTTVRP